MQPNPTQSHHGDHRCGSVARLRQTLGGRSGGPLIHSSYTTRRDTTENPNYRSSDIFMVEQNATMALSIAHRGYIIQNGVIVLEGDAKALLGNPTV